MSAYSEIVQWRCCVQVQARIQHLRELQEKHDEYEGAYRKELKALQAKFATLYGVRIDLPSDPWHSRP